MTRTYFSVAFISLMCLTPLNASAAPSSSVDCKEAQGKMEQARDRHIPINLKREATQERVRQMYQELFICHSTNIVSKKQELHCQQLEEEATNQFQAMIQLVTASHHASRQVETLTKHVQTSCSHAPAPPLTHISQLTIR